MPDTTNLIRVSGDEIVNTTVFPDTKLQTLDRRVGKDQLYFDRKLFELSVSDWNGIPVIYQPNGIHPTDFDAVNRDPETAAQAIGGKWVGSVSNPRVVVPGGARLMAQLDIGEDEDEIMDQWRQGTLFPSTAFTAKSDGDRLVSPPIPNHVLLFPIEVDKVLPGDYGAFVNTLEVQTTMKKSKVEVETKPACNAEIVPVTDDEKKKELQEPVTTPEAEPSVPEQQAPAPAESESESVEGTDAVKTMEAVDEVADAVEEVAGDVAEKQNELESIRAELDALKDELATLKAVATQSAETAQTVATQSATVTNSEDVPADADDANASEPVAEEIPVTADAVAVVAEGIDDEIKWRDEMIAELKAEVEALKAGKAALEEKMKSAEEAAAEAEFNSIVEKLPVGMKATPEQIEALHTEYKAGNMKAMLFTVLNGSIDTGATQRVGQPFTQSTKVNQQLGVGDLNKPRNKLN